MEEFFEEQLVKLLPDYASKRNVTNGSTRGHESKRIRIENQRSTETIDDGDDDVIFT